MSTNISFSVSASGYTPITYQWQSGSTNLSDGIRISGSVSISGSNSSSLIINDVQATDTGSYRVFAYNLGANATSSYASLNIVYVGYPPVIVRHPEDVYVYLDATASFNVIAFGSPTLLYQWSSGSTNLVDGVRITGSNSASLIINNIQWSDSGSYKVLVWNSVSSSYSNEADLYVFENVITRSVSDSMSSTVGETAGSYVESPITEVGTATTAGILSGSYTLEVYVTSASDSGSLDIGFDSGTVVTVIQTVTGSNDSASLDVGFYSGEVLTVILTVTGSNDSASLDVGFYSGEVLTLVTEVSQSEAINPISVGLYSGSYDS